MEIYGDIGSLKSSTIEEIQGIYDMEISAFDFIPESIINILCEISSKINREIGVYLNRKGKVVKVFIGDNKTIELPELDIRRDFRKLSGIRCIHTHPGSTGELSLVDLNSLISMKFDAMIAIGIDQKVVNSIYTAFLLHKDGEYKEYEIFGPLNGTTEENDYFLQLIQTRDKEIEEKTYIVSTDEERAILVGIDKSNSKSKNNKNNEDKALHLEELEELALTAGCIVITSIVQKKSSPDSAFYLGKGKIEELALVRQALDANVLIFDDELSGAQIKNIENMVGTKVVDRTSLILDIFAKRAHSKEGKLQVELAQLKYRLPRLIGLGHVLSRLGGGIGTRGPGEKKLETDRRHIKKRIQNLETELKCIVKRRDVLKKSREANGLQTVAIVGYTNAGKSTLLNTLCNADVFVEDKLFATLDPTVRGVKLSDGREALMVDTVGFIRKLPHQLVQSFKSTLEEVLYADLLLHVVDITHPEFENNIKVVQELLLSIGAGHKKMLIVYNKIDLMKEQIILPNTNESYLKISAQKRLGLDELIASVTDILKLDEKRVIVHAPYSEGWIYSYLCQNGKVLSKEYEEDILVFEADIKLDKLKKIEKYIVN